MKKKLLSMVVLATLSLTSLVGCGSQKSEDEILIGGIGPLTGDASSYGTSVKNGAELFLDEYNANGGFDGKKIKLLFEDDEADATKALNAYDKLVNKEEVSMVFGAVTSGSSTAIADRAKSDQIPMISPTATEPNITKKGGEYVFRGCYIDSLQGETLSKYAIEDLSAKKASILYNVSSDYSKGIAETFKKKFEAAGGEVVSFDSYNSGDKDFSAQLTKIKNLNPDVLVLPDYYDTVGLITDQARTAGITAQFLGGDGWDSPKLFEIGGDSVEGAIFVNHYSPEDESEDVQKFVKSYKEKYNADPDAFAALSYSTLQVLTKAIESAGSTDADAVKDALAKTDLDTITGHVTFDKNRNPIKSVSVIKIQDGKQTLVKKINP